MKKVAKVIALCLTIAMLPLILFTGCGNSNNNSVTTNQTTLSSEAPKQQESEAPKQQEKTEPITLKFTCWGSPQEQVALDNAIKKFEEKFPLIKVNKIHIPTDYDTKITTMVAANEAPDLAYLESATIAFPLAEQGKLFNLKEYVDTDPDIVGKLVPNSFFYWAPGKIAGISGGPETFVLFYNVDMFKDAGVEVPPSNPENAWTWDKFVEVAKKLTIDKNGKNASESGFDYKNIVQYGVNMPLWWGVWGNFIYSNGGDFISEDGTKLALNQPEAVEALQKIADLMNVHHVMPTTVASKSLPGTTQSLQTKKVAMAIDGQWVNLDLGAATDLNYDCGVLPKLKKPVTQVVFGCTSIFSSSEHPKEAWELLKFLLNPEYSLDLHKGGLWMPIFKDWYTNPELVAKWAENNKAHPSGFKGAVLDMMMNYSVITPTATVKNFSQILNIVNPAFDKFWSGEMTVADALKSVEAKAQEQVAGRRSLE